MRRLFSFPGWLLWPLMLILILEGEQIAHATCAVPNSGAFAFEQLTISTTAVSLTSATYDPATGTAQSALVTVDTNPLRFRADGTNPTAAIGHNVTAGNSIEVCGISNIRNFRAIRSGAADAVINVSYYRP